MEPFARFVGSLLGVGVGAGVGVTLFLWLARSALERAVTQAQQRDIEKYKSELQRTLQVERAAAEQSFARDLDERRILAQRDLESFKADLTLAAEVRRHVAAKKVEVLLELADKFNTMFLTTLLIELGVDKKTDETKDIQFRTAIGDAIGAVFPHRHLFTEETADALSSLGLELAAEKGKALLAKPTELKRVHDRVLTLVRRELGLASASVSNEATSDSPPKPADKLSK